MRTGRTELPVRPLARCRPRTIERRRLPTARGSVSSWRCSSAHFLFLVLSSLPFLHSSSFRSAADRDPWPEPPQIPITGAAADPHRRSHRVARSRRCPRSRAPEPPSSLPVTAASRRAAIPVAHGHSTRRRLRPPGPASPAAASLRLRCLARGRARLLLPHRPVALPIRPLFATLFAELARSIPLMWIQV